MTKISTLKWFYSEFGKNEYTPTMAYIHIWTFWLAARSEYFFLLEINFHVFIYSLGMIRETDKEEKCIWKFKLM